jgi:glycosyltransferase involved in cell wall biosynthesis
MTTTLPITAYTLSFNEARQIRLALESISWADEILLVDSFSTDGTVEIATQCGAKVLSHAFCGFGKLRNLALDAARHDWIFSLDADERCTAELRDEIGRELAHPKFDAYHVPRKSHFLNHWMRHADWYPDYRQPQFFNRRHMRYREDSVHEGFEVNGRLGYLREHALQYPWPTMEVATAKLQRYSTLMAQRYFEQQRQAPLARLLLHPLAMFFRTYLLKQGFRDGVPGLILSGLMSYYTFLKYAKLWALRQSTLQTEKPQALPTASDVKS